MLEIKNLSVQLGDRELLHDVNLTVGTGARHLLRGANGSGKTTLAQTIGGAISTNSVQTTPPLGIVCHSREGGNDGAVLRVGGGTTDIVNKSMSPHRSANSQTDSPQGGSYKTEPLVTSGQIIFDGHDITSENATTRALMGIFLGAQNVPEIPGLTVMSFLRHSLVAHTRFETGKDLSAGLFYQKLMAARERLSIPEEWLSRSINLGFSGGERKRLMFLRLLMTRPKVAILDEPDSGADASAQKLFADIIMEMNGQPTAHSPQPTAFLIISHQQHFTDMIQPTAITDLKDGRVVV